MEPKVFDRKPQILELDPGKYAWCACGESKNQPFCDGSHKGTGLAPVRFEVEQAQRKAMCLCKQTQNQPFCDGTHKGLD
jgi:CDGSH-type Zn-finger protein